MTSYLNLGPYLQHFKGREDYFAQQGENGYYPVPRTLDEYYIRRHLEGDATFGLYVLNRESFCHLVCIDIDIPQSQLSKVDFEQPEVKYAYLKDKLNAVLEALFGQLGAPPGSILLEDTGGRGYHIWMFFSEPVQGRIAVALGEALKSHLDFEIEFFPKQGRLTPKRKYGNLIKLPLGLHRKYGSWSFFLSLSKEGPQPIVGKEENIAHLRSLVPVTPETIDKAIKILAEKPPLWDETPIPIRRLAHKRRQFEGNPD
jgi:hypothetical protein